MKENYEFYWIGRCQYADVDKIWGAFRYVDSPKSKKSRAIYTFWGLVNKRISMTHHPHGHRYVIDSMIQKKEKNKYVKITASECETLFKDFYESLDTCFVFHKLSQSTE